MSDGPRPHFAVRLAIDSHNEWIVIVEGRLPLEKAEELARQLNVREVLIKQQVDIARALLEARQTINKTEDRLAIALDEIETMKVKESEDVKRERREHPERFAPKDAPSGFGGYSVAHIAQVLREAKEEIARRKSSAHTNKSVDFDPGEI